MPKRSITLSSFSTALLAAALSVTAAADNGLRGTRAPVATNTAPVAKFIPVASWNVDVAGGQAALRHKPGATSGGSQKAATDLITLFRPLAGCRLYDSRNGNPSALGIVGGSWFANDRRTLTVSGACGIPTNNVTGLSLAINVFNYNAPATGRIAMMPVGGSVGGRQVGLSSTPWFWTTATVAPSSNGSFDVQMFDVISELIIDVNGYYQNSDTIDSTTQMDINYSGVGDAFAVNVLSTTTDTTGLVGSNSSPTGTAIRADSVAAGTALSVSGGKVRVPGAGVGSGNFVFQFSTNTAGTASAGAGTGCFSGTSDIHVITHPMTDATPDAILFITPKLANTGGDGSHLGTAMYRALYLGGVSCGGGAGTNKWSIQDVNGGLMANAAKFNIMVITP